jgi:hypothetical protein
MSLDWLIEPPGPFAAGGGLGSGSGEARRMRAELARMPASAGVLPAGNTRAARGRRP